MVFSVRRSPSLLLLPPSTPALHLPPGLLPGVPSSDNPFASLPDLISRLLFVAETEQSGVRQIDYVEAGVSRGNVWWRDPWAFRKEATPNRTSNVMDPYCHIYTKPTTRITLPRNTPPILFFTARDSNQGSANFHTLFPLPHISVLIRVRVILFWCVGKTGGNIIRSFEHWQE